MHISTNWLVPTHHEYSGDFIVKAESECAFATFIYRCENHWITLQGRRMGWGTEDGDIRCSLGPPGHQTIPCYFLVVNVWRLCSHYQLKNWKSDVSYQSHTIKSCGGGGRVKEYQIHVSPYDSCGRNRVFSASSKLSQTLHRRVYASTTLVPKFNFSNCSVHSYLIIKYFTSPTHHHLVPC